MPVGELKLDLAFQVDQLALTMLMVVTGVGSLIHLFSVGYMKADAGYPRYFAYLNLFIAFMVVLVLGSSLPVLFIGWEGVGLCSYLLIGFWFGDKANADAGQEGLHRQPHRRLRRAGGDVHHLAVAGHAQLHGDRGTGAGGASRWAEPR